MERIFEIFSPEVIPEVKKLYEYGFPDNKRGEVFRGHQIIPGFSAEAAKDGYENWSFRKTDVLVVSYPKTGTNLIIDVVRRILFQDSSTKDLLENVPASLTFLETLPGNKFRFFNKILMEQRMMSTHLPADLINMEGLKKAGAKVIYILRNPKDQMVSWLKFALKLPQSQVEPLKSMITSGWNTFFEHVVKGDFEMNSKPGEWYPEHILSWCKHRDNKTVYFVYFEDLKKNPEREIKLMAEFLEVPITDELIKEIATETSFETMKQNIDKVQSELLKQFRHLNMRKGTVGGWKDHFTVTQSERVDTIMEEKLKDTDVKFIYD